MLGLELLSFISVSQTGLLMVLFVWPLAISSCGLHPFSRLAQNLPWLIQELRIQLNLHYLLARVSRLALYANSRRNTLPPLFSAKFLLRRDGQDIFDFLKTFSLNDVSPPVLV